MTTNKPELVLAPMLKITNSYFRDMIMVISPNTKLFTEMIVANTVIHAKDINRKLGSPINTTVQIGGSDPKQIAEAIQIIKKRGFTSFNLNCGCPSTKVKKGCFGAILMLMPDVVIDIINTVYEKTGIVMSIKCRIGVDDKETFDFFKNFIDKIVKNTKCKTFYVHCRKCLLNGISPKENRKIPNLDYSFADKTKEIYKDIKVYINGGIKSYKDMKYKTDGYMIGREAVKNPFVFAEIEKQFENVSTCTSNTICGINYKSKSQIACNSENDFTSTLEHKKRVLLEYLSLYDENVTSHLINPIMQIFKGEKNSKKYKETLSIAVKNKMHVNDLKNAVLRLFETR